MRAHPMSLHARLERHDVAVDVIEVARPELVDGASFVVGQRKVGCGGVLTHVVDREHRRQYTREACVGQYPCDCRLTDRTAGLRRPEERERLGLLEVVE